MAREKRLFSNEFKREAAKLVGYPGASKAAIGCDLCIGANLLAQYISIPELGEIAWAIDALGR